jgi:hypothetical protein
MTNNPGINREENMICPYCGKENPDTLSLCNFCGGRLVELDDRNISQLPVPDTSIQPYSSTDKSISEDEQTAQQPESTPGEPAFKEELPAAQLEAFDFEPETPIKPSKSGCSKWIWWFLGCFVIACLIISCVTVLWGFYSFSAALDFLKEPTSTPAVLHLPTSTFLPAVIDEPPATPTLPPSAIALPTFTYTPDPTLSSQEVLFYDDFSDPSSGWDQVNEPSYATDYFENSYRIYENETMSDIWSNPDTLSFGDVTIEVDATKKAGPDDNDFGVICRYQDTNHFYYGIISSDGYFGIIKVTSDGSETLGRENLEFSDSINQKYASNHIRLDCIGDVLTLYVNGDQLDQQTDGELATGNVGLIAGTYNTAGTDILFDNFIVLKP